MYVIYPLHQLGGGQSETWLRRRFNLNDYADLDLPYGIVSTTDWNWGLMFFTPPNKIEALRIDNDIIFGGMSDSSLKRDFSSCLRKENAYMTLVTSSYKNKNNKNLYVVTKEWFQNKTPQSQSGEN